MRIGIAADHGGFGLKQRPSQPPGGQVMKLLTSTARANRVTKSG